MLLFGVSRRVDRNENGTPYCQYNVDTSSLAKARPQAGHFRCLETILSDRHCLQKATSSSQHTAATGVNPFLILTVETLCDDLLLHVVSTTRASQKFLSDKSLARAH